MALGDEDAGEFSEQLDKFAKAIEAYEHAVEAMKHYLHATRPLGCLNKSCEKLNHYLNTIKPWLTGESFCPSELDFCMDDIFPTSFFDRDLQRLIEEPLQDKPDTGNSESSGWDTESDE